MKTLIRIGEAALFGCFVVGLGCFVVGLGMLICLFVDVSFKWAPLLGALGLAGLIRAGNQM